MSPIKPAFPNPSTALTQASLEKLRSLVKQVEQADGSVDMTQLGAKVEASGDSTLSNELEAIKDAFQRTKTITYTSSCGGTQTRTEKKDPLALSATEVLSVLGALIEAKQKVSDLDTNHDGKIQKSEAKGIAQLGGLSGNLAEAAVDGTLKEYRLEMSKWNDALSQVAKSVDDRKKLDGDIVHLASHHAASAEGRDAIIWAYRDLATLGHDLDVWSIRKALEDAETSFLRYFPLFGIARRAKSAEGHLSNFEVASMFETSSSKLQDFADAKKAAVETRLSMSYDDYLKGKDLPGASGLSDPDFHRTSVSSNC